MASQQPSVFDLPKVVAVGIVSPAAAALTSRFGIAGTLLGLFLSSVLITAGVDFLKFYLARVPGAVISIPGGFRKRSTLQNVLERMKRPFSKLASLPQARRRSLLKRSLVAAGVSFIVGLILITTLEVGVGKSLSCWVWDECSTAEASADGSSTQASSTLPTILGGGQSVSSSSNTPQQKVGVGPSSSQQQQSGEGGASPSGAPQGAPWQATPEEVPSSETPQPSSAAQPGQRQGPSGPVGGGRQQEVPSRSASADQQQQPNSAGGSEEEGSGAQ